jgi:CRISPR-associated endonuclease Csn1
VKTLGIDIGTASVGTALVGDTRILAATVRIFEAGTEGDIKGGRDQSPNLARRNARQQRRQINRRARKASKLYNLLVRHGLLPRAADGTSEARQATLTALDLTLRNPYQLRAAALDAKLQPFEFGRALFHLSQRRGFLSSRKQAAKPSEELGVVKQGISDLARAIEAAGCRTLGEYFNTVDPQVARIRGRYTARKMYLHEFELLWAAQAAHHPNLLTDDLHRKVFKTIFFQRPLKSQADKIGYCSIDGNEKRCPVYLRIAQRYRLIEQVNNLEVDGRALTQDERTTLIHALENQGDMTFGAVRKLLGLKKGKFNLEAVDEKRLIGNRTNAAMLAALGEYWLALDGQGRDALVEYSWGFEKQDKLAGAAAKKFGWPVAVAEKFAAVPFEAGYLLLSRRVIEEALPRLEAGDRLVEIRSDLMPATERPIFKLLPSLDEAAKYLGPVWSLTVRRSLTEMRKVVNALIRQHGLPDTMRVELARDLRKSRKRREEIHWSQNENKERREAAAAKILAEIGDPQPSRDDIEKVLLAEECGWHDPYTNAPISMRQLIGDEAMFQVEHIVPYSKSFDNSFANKTLCPTKVNVDKGNRTPYEAFGSDEAMLDRVAKFSSTFAKEKLRRFKMHGADLDEWLANFSPRALADTSTAARYAVRYLGLLYENPSSVRTTNGVVTAIVRRGLQLSGVLGDATTPKCRDDHRHHAVDALAIALTSDKLIAQISRQAETQPHKRGVSLEAPWPDFTDSARAAIRGIVVSHRQRGRIRGAIHDQTTYSGPINRRNHVRKPLAAMTANQIVNIVDPAVRAVVLTALKGGDPKKVFKSDADLPTMHGHKIRAARISCALNRGGMQIGSAQRVRFVESAANHHIEIFDGPKGWVSFIVTRREALRRLQAHLPIVNRQLEGHRFVMALTNGDTVTKTQDGRRELFVVRKLSYEAAGNRVGFKQIDDAGTGAAKRVFVTLLREMDFQKVRISPTGCAGATLLERET